jgi:hypothetical protein
VAPAPKVPQLSVYVLVIWGPTLSGQGLDEVTLREFINSVWFKGISRAAMIFTSVAFAIFVGAWSIVAGNTDKRVTAVDTQVKSVIETQTLRTHDSEQFQDQTTRDLGAVKADIANLKVDVRVVRTLLQQMAAVRNNPHETPPIALPQPAPPLGLLATPQEVAARP